MARCEREGGSFTLPERIAWSDSASTSNGLVCDEDAVLVVATEEGTGVIVAYSSLLPADLARGVHFPDGVRGNSLTYSRREGMLHTQHRKDEGGCVLVGCWIPHMERFTRP